MVLDTLEHYGVARRSGRYPWGSGKDPQRSRDLLNKIDELKSKGITKETDIAAAMGMNTTELRNAKAWANDVRKQVIMDGITSRKERGLSNVEIAKEMNISEASVRNYMSNKDKIVEKQLDNVTDVLRENVDKLEYLDVGIGSEIQLGVSRNKMKTAISKLKEEGYVEHELYVRRLHEPSKFTTVTVLTKEKDLEVVKANSDKIAIMESYVTEGGLNKHTIDVKNPKKVSWDRLQIAYDEDGGTTKDGLIELRKGPKDLDLGDAKYAQVRIKVGDKHYLKGMAMYTDDLPDGVDIRFNTNKSNKTPKEKVLKELKQGKDNVFGATISRQKGALNIVNQEGDWDEWNSVLSSQFLSKQPVSLVKERIEATKNKLNKDLANIQSLTNPIVKKHLLEAHDKELNSKSQHLKLVGLPRTKPHVILPFNEMKPGEIYAPNYNNGEKVVLLRYPHGGRFELPELTVNNKQSRAKKLLGSALDAVGIHPSVAQKLSGADFDGDTVYLIPNNNLKVKTSKTLSDLKDFDPQVYKVDRPTITAKYKNTQMGIVSNLITDMTIKGASQSELARAVKHSMVVIDSEKHQLDYKQSAIDNGISALQKKYQTYVSKVDGKQHTAASTLISRSKSTVSVIEKNPRTGKEKTVKIPIADYVKDAHKLSSGTAVESLYADYINQLKATSNAVQKEIKSIPPIRKNKEASKKYANEVKTLETKLNVALANAPRERQAQILASQNYYKNLDYSMDKAEKKRLKTQSLLDARAKKNPNGKTLVNVTPSEWEAMQKGAISNNMFELILKNADMDQIKQYATPRTSKSMTKSAITKARTYLSKGYSYAEVASALGVSTTIIKENLANE